MISPPLRISGTCSETEVSEQLLSINCMAGAVNNIFDTIFLTGLLRNPGGFTEVPALFRPASTKCIPMRTIQFFLDFYESARKLSAVPPASKSPVAGLDRSEIKTYYFAVDAGYAHRRMTVFYGFSL
jgi:hypothetical protein